MVVGTITQIIPVGNGDEIHGYTIRLDAPMTLVPGQYVMIEHPAIPGKKRSFSITAANGNELTLYIKKIGEVTNALHAASVGQQVSVTGPYGRFVLPPEDKSFVLIAGGIGVTPLYCMTKGVVTGKSKKKIYFFYSNKTRAETALYNEIMALNDPRVKKYWSFTREQVPGASMERISADMIRQNVPEYANCDFYICGPKPMMDELITQLKASGITDDHIHTENFNPTNA